MEFKSLKEKCCYYRDLTDYKLMPNSYVLCMVDGRAFSHYIKKKFQLPFDDEFIYMMNESAKYVCENVSGCRFAYTQSDEVSFLITDFHKEDDCIVNEASFFGYRLCKMQSIIASLMTAKFNQLMSIKALELSKISAYKKPPEEILNDVGLVQFDCKCWTVPNANDVYAWFLFRQLDCIRNSKQAVAQSVCSHKMLEGKNTDEQIELAKQNGSDWYDFGDDKKFGRFIYRSEETFVNNDITYTRNYFKVFSGCELKNTENKNWFMECFCKI